MKTRLLFQFLFCQKNLSALSVSRGSSHLYAVDLMQDVVKTLRISLLCRTNTQWYHG